MANTLMENTIRAIEDLDNIKDAIEYKGVPVPTPTPTSEYGDLIKSIPSGISGAIFVESDVWEEIDLPEELQNFTIYAFASRGAIYIGSNSPVTTGIWKFDIATKVFTKVYSSYYNWQHWFESSNGDLFVSSGLSGSGILKLNDERTEFIRIHSIGYNWKNWFETSRGEIFVSASISNSMGILKFNEIKNEFIQIHSISYNWQSWFESSKGDIFASSSIASTGIIKINEARNEFIQIQTIGSSWLHWFESSQGEVFVSSDANLSASTGIWKFNDDEFIRIFSTSYRWMHWFESSLNEIFISSSVVAGIWKLNETRDTFISIHSSASNWQHWFETSQGEIFTSSLSTTGIWKLNETRNGIFSVFSSNYNWGNWFELSENELFVSSLTYSGIVKLDSDRKAFTMIFPLGVSYSGKLNNYFVSNNFPLEIAGFPIFDIESLTPTKFTISGTIIGNWILNSSQFTEFTGKTPMKIFIPTFTTPFTPIGDAEGNVFLVAKPKLIFNVKPLK